MANQMIALQSRAPQLPDPSRLTAQYANMMNMTRQQEAAERQAAAAQQQMDYATAEEGRKKDLHGPALTKAQQDNAVQALEMFRERVGDIAEGDVAAAEAVRADLVARIPGYDQFIPPASQWTRDTIERLMMTSEQEIGKLYATPTTETIFGPDNKLYVAQKGGLNEGLRPLINRPPVGAPAESPRATPTAPQTPTGSARTGKFGEALVVPEASVPLSPYQQDHIRQMQEGLGMTNTPASFSPGASAGQMTPQRAQQVVDAAVKTGMMAQEDFDQMIAMTPEQNKQPFMEMIRTNNITLQPGGMGRQSQFAVNQGQRPQVDFAVNRGATPPATLAQTNVVGQQAYGRSGSPTSPLPGSSQVPLPRLGAEKTTETQAAENVRLKMAPQIAAATKTAERAVERKPEALAAKNETKAAIQSLDRYIEEIDALLRSADRRSIVGRFEGRIPYGLQDERQSELQAMYDRVKNANTLGALVEAKQATPSGGSPVGPASNTDVQLVAKSASSLTQTGGVPKFDEDLKKLRREAYQTRQRRIEFYSDRYGDLAAEDPKFKLNVRPIADRYISSKDLPKNKTPVVPTLTPEQVRANPNIKRWKRADNGQIMVRK
jgi:hypothetical protein